MSSESKQRPSHHAARRYAAKISGLGNQSLGQILRDEFSDGSTSALGVVSAFVSVGGFRDLLSITSACESLDCRLLAGVSAAITHPKALIEALDAGWNVRLGFAPKNRMFHPKMILAGRSFRADGSVKGPSFVYVGSSNLTVGGLHRNIECGVVGHQDFTPPSLVSCFAALWNSGKRATASRIQSYAEVFAKRNRQRSMEDMDSLGISDVGEEDSFRYEQLKRTRTATKGEAMPETAAAAAWAGLESFTGEYKFQVEFPQAAGLVLNRIIGRAGRQHVPILCVEDGQIRSISYRFYTDNGMFRLNIPNDAPGVKRARQRHKGIALVEASERSDVVAQLTLLAPGPRLEDVVRRSVLLGTWGSTPTRSYGWY